MVLNPKHVKIYLRAVNKLGNTIKEGMELSFGLCNVAMPQHVPQSQANVSNQMRVKAKEKSGMYVCIYSCLLSIKIALL